MKNILVKLFFIILFIFNGVAACSKFPIKPEPVVTYNTFTDFTYPCIKVTFDGRVDYTSASLVKNKKIALTTVQHNLTIASKNYIKIKILKMHTDNITEGWLLEPVSEQYSGNEVLKVINGDIDKSSVLILAQVNGDIILRSITGGVGMMDAYTLIADRTVAKSGHNSAFDFHLWKNTVTGKKILLDMETFTDYIYNNIHITDCRDTSVIDRGVK